MSDQNISKEQEAHLNFVLYKFGKLMTPKFIKGAVEHGTLLHEADRNQLLDFALEEAIDQFVYLATLRYGDEFAGLIANHNAVTSDDDRDS